MPAWSKSMQSEKCIRCENTSLRDNVAILDGENSFDECFGEIPGTLVSMKNDRFDLLSKSGDPNGDILFSCCCCCCCFWRV
jgi:hypothetical protein